MQKFKPQKKTELLWCIRCVIVWLILCITLSMFHVKLKAFIIMITAAALLLLAVIVYLHVYFKKYSIMVNERAIIIKSGVIIKTEKILPRPRMIFAERFTTPIARVFGLSQLSLRAIRTNLITVELTNGQIKSILGVISGGDEERTF